MDCSVTENDLIIGSVCKNVGFQILFTTFASVCDTYTFDLTKAYVLVESVSVLKCDSDLASDSTVEISVRVFCGFYSKSFNNRTP